MTTTNRFRAALDERLGNLPPVPYDRYLTAGRRAVRRRKRRYVGLGACTAALLVSAGWALPPEGGPQRALEANPMLAGSSAPSVGGSSTPPSPGAPTPLSAMRVEPGVGDIETYTTTDIPPWAQEAGQHGPVSIAPDGRLWIAPGVTVVQSIEDPVAEIGASAGVLKSYAVEVRGFKGSDKAGGNPSDDDAWWSIVFQFNDRSVGGQMDRPQRWTVDLAVWTYNMVAGHFEETGFAESLVSFASEQSTELVPGPGVTVVRQAPFQTAPGWQDYPRQTAAEVRINGQTWFVVGFGKKNGAAFFDAYDMRSAGVTDFEGFLRFAAEGFYISAQAGS